MEKYKPEPGYREPYTEYGMEIVMFCAKHCLTKKALAAEAGRLLVQLQRSTIYKERWRKERLAAIEAVERNVKARMRQAVQNDPELLAQLQRLVSDAAAEEAGRDEG